MHEETSQRPVKQRKMGSVTTNSSIPTSNPSAARLDQLQQELECLKKKHQQPVAPHVQVMRQLLQQREALSKEVDQLKTESQLHNEWLQEICYLLASSPLFDQDLQLVHQRKKKSSLAETLLRNKKLPACSKVLMEDRFRVLKQLSVENGRSMLNELMHTPANRFQVTFTSRGWQFECIGKGCLLTFRGKRQLIQGNLVKDVAYEFWQCTQREEVQRAFIPAMEQFNELYALPLCSLTRRVFHLTHFTNADIALVTLDSLHLLETKPNGDQTTWLLTIESVHDSFLEAYARAALNHQQELRKGNNSVASKISTVTTNISWYHPQFDISDNAHSASPIKSLSFNVLLTQQLQRGPIEIQMSGSFHNSHQLTKTIAIELLQYLVVTMPLFEELHLLRPNSIHPISSTIRSPTTQDSSAQRS
jgi:hypothetical protein